MMNTLLSAEPRTLHVAKLATSDYDDTEIERPVADIETANVVSSIMRGHTPAPGGGGSGHHLPVLDLDVPAVLIPSSTDGHWHLYLDVQVPDAAYWPMLEALATAGVLEGGYVRASKARGYTSVRLPWVKKSAVEA